MKNGLLIFIAELGIGPSGDTGVISIDYTIANKVKNKLNKALKKDMLDICIYLDDDENQLDNPNIEYDFYILTPFVASKHKKEFSKPIISFDKLSYHKKDINKVYNEIKSL